MDDQFKKIWAPLATIVGAVLLVFQLAQAFTGNRDLITEILILVGLVLIAVSIWDYAFGYSHIRTKNGYLPKHKHHRLAKTALGVISIFFIVELLYVLTILDAVPDCCGFVATTTPTQTGTFTPPTQTLIPTHTAVIINTGTSTPIILTATPSMTPTPEMNPVVDYYTAVEGDTLPKVSKNFFPQEKYGSAIGKANCITILHTGDRLTIKYYIVKAGDTLNSIANQFNISVAYLQYINGFEGDFIRPNDIFILPIYEQCPT